MQVVMCPLCLVHVFLHPYGSKEATKERAAFLKWRSFPEPVAKGGDQMEPSVLIAALALAVDLFRAVFDVAWEIHKEKKHDKKEK